MNGFFQSLLARSRADTGVVRPRVPSMFEAPQVSDAGPLEETSVVETSTRPMRGAIERPTAHSIPASASAPQAHAYARPPSVEVQAVADHPRERKVLSEPGEAEIKSAPRQQPRFEATAARILSNFPSSSSTVTEESQNSSVTREIHETREVHETLREQRTFLDRTFLERIAQAGRRSPQTHPANPPAINAEPEVHVSIGRIEVRAVNDTPAARKTQQQHSPVMGLDEYLRHKAKGAAQ